MSIYNYEDEIEDQIIDALVLNNDTFQVERYYENASSQMLLDFVLSKIKSKPSVFVRCNGFQNQTQSTTLTLGIASYEVQIICAANDNGKARQIRNQKRKVNRLINTVLERLNSLVLDLSEQSNVYINLQSVRDLFTADSIDARMINITIDGIVIDMDTGNLQGNLSSNL